MIHADFFSWGNSPYYMSIAGSNENTTTNQSVVHIPHPSESLVAYEIHVIYLMDLVMNTKTAESTEIYMINELKIGSTSDVRRN